jgi:hypothetical protein
VPPPPPLPEVVIGDIDTDLSLGRVALTGGKRPQRLRERVHVGGAGVSDIRFAEHLRRDEVERTEAPLPHGYGLLAGVGHEPEVADHPLTVVAEEILRLQVPVADPFGGEAGERQRVLPHRIDDVRERRIAPERICRALSDRGRQPRPLAGARIGQLGGEQLQHPGVIAQLLHDRHLVAETLPAISTLARKHLQRAFAEPGTSRAHLAIATLPERRDQRPVVDSIPGLHAPHLDIPRRALSV